MDVPLEEKVKVKKGISPRTSNSAVKQMKPNPIIMKKVWKPYKVVSIDGFVTIPMNESISEPEKITFEPTQSQPVQEGEASDVPLEEAKQLSSVPAVAPAFGSEASISPEDTSSSDEESDSSDTDDNTSDESANELKLAVVTPKINPRSMYTDTYLEDYPPRRTCAGALPLTVLRSMCVDKNDGTQQEKASSPRTVDLEKKSALKSNGKPKTRRETKSGPGKKLLHLEDEPLVCLAVHRLKATKKHTIKEIGQIFDRSSNWVHDVRSKTSCVTGELLVPKVRKKLGPKPKATVADEAIRRYVAEFHSTSSVKIALFLRENKIASLSENSVRRRLKALDIAKIERSPAPPDTETRPSTGRDILSSSPKFYNPARILSSVKTRLPSATNGSCFSFSGVYRQ
ncbi:hypothetical protein RvY_04489 [Ramazzottius varieornatus]|uniref:Uncharacterized protein n=1 Tax=Ramazzottius varieornatus TaxID=947166 RepID=A0A1D1URT1_RAMVA|nr:hypothetical protein RvY_04489 [Ramazzottius varieornatus]